jgi:hypothetical protein
LTVVTTDMNHNSLLLGKFSKKYTVFNLIIVGGKVTLLFSFLSIIPTTPDAVRGCLSTPIVSFIPIDYYKVPTTILLRLLILSALSL